MAIDLGKSGDGTDPNPSSNNGGNSNSSNQASASQKDYNNPDSHPDVRQIYVFAYECKRKNMPDYQIEQSLMNRGLDPAEVGVVMRNVNRVHSQNQQANSQSNGGGGGKISGGLIIIGLIILFDILSFAFGWGFILY